MTWKPTPTQIDAKVASYAKRSHVLEANTLRLSPCKKCGAALGDPCRSPSWRTREPHSGRKTGQLEPALVECRTCLGVGRIRDGETNELRKCLDCNGSGQ